MRPSLKRLRSLIPAESRSLLEAVIEEANASGVHAWLVGGAVRDLALDRVPPDLDTALRGDAGAFAARVVGRLHRDLTTAATVDQQTLFGTTTIRITGAHLDLARIRSEYYVAPGALPTVAFVQDIEADLGRRDFSVNAMALVLDGPATNTVIDPFGGLPDLAARRLRVLHTRSFEDDATRLWRAARSAAAFGLVAEPLTAGLIAEGARWLDTISGTRIMAELRATADRGRAGRTLALAEDWGVLHGTHPELRLGPTAARALRHRSRPMPLEVLTAVLLAPLPAAPAILARLVASRSVAVAVEQAAALLAAGLATDTAVRSLPAPEQLAPLIAAPEKARVAARWLDPDRQPSLQRALRRWENTRPAIDARALIRLGVLPGPELGAALDRLRRARYLGTLRTPAEARRDVRQTATAHNDETPKTR